MHATISLFSIAKPTSRVFGQTVPHRSRVEQYVATTVGTVVFVTMQNTFVDVLGSHWSASNDNYFMAAGWSTAQHDTGTSRTSSLPSLLLIRYERQRVLHTNGRLPGVVCLWRACGVFFVSFIFAYRFVALTWWNCTA